MNISALHMPQGMCMCGVCVCVCACVCVCMCVCDGRCMCERCDGIVGNM